MKILIALAALAVLAGALLVESIATCQFIIPDRVKRASEGMNRLLLLIPALAVPVFAVLFLFVLKGRFYERLCHATLLLALWLCATRSYWFLISFFKSCRILPLSILGVIGFTAMAVYLTPLDRYAETIHSFFGPVSILAGAILLLVFYIAAFLCRPRT